LSVAIRSAFWARIHWRRAPFLQFGYLRMTGTDVPSGGTGRRVALRKTLQSRSSLVFSFLQAE
jgi:hypothetical protein